MRKILSVLALILLAASPLEAAQRFEWPKEDEKAAPREAKGLEWMQMSVNERLTQLLYALGRLQKAGVVPGRTINDYYNTINTRLRSGVGEYETPLTQVLADHIYADEPENRPALDRLRKKETS